MDEVSAPDLAFEQAATDFLTPTPAPRRSPSSACIGRVDTTLMGEVDEDDLEALNEIAAEEDDFNSVANDDYGLGRESSWELATSRPKRLKPITVQLPRSTLVYPRSVCANFEPRIEPVRESQAVERLLNADPSQKDEDFIEFELDDFSCYVHTPQYDSEMRALHSHATSTGNSTFYFDGILRVGTVECYVKRVAFEEIPLGNYGKEEPTVGDQIWIRSHHNSRQKIYYKLGRPTLEYERYHKSFTWVADLAKHVVDFCTHKLERHNRDVSIHLFKTEFSAWLKAMHKKDATGSFQRWYAQRGSDDFRQSIVATNAYIRKEVWGIFSMKQLRRIRIFGEITNPYNSIPVQGQLPSKDEFPRTIVTPYIYDCFSHLESGTMLQPLEPTIGTNEAIEKSWPQKMSKESAFIQKGIDGAGDAIADRIRPGHLISTPPDQETVWKTRTMDKKWYALVQKVRKTERGKLRFDVTWLYQPEDTPCCSMKYPWGNELFLSNHCTCYEDAKVHSDQILGVHSVEWHGNPDTRAEFFVRQTYLSDERRFITLEEAHRQCDHRHTASKEYAPGDTVLVRLSRNSFLEACEVVGYMGATPNRKVDQVRVRKLTRRSEMTNGCPPNELVYTEDEVACDASAIATRCIIRCYAPNEIVPVPYNQRGVGNAFFVTHRMIDGSLQPWTRDFAPPSFRQGFDPTQRAEKLRAMDLFSGFGNFGRGLEDGGAVEAKWANDIWDVAAHTYKANSRDPYAMNPFLGSIDDLLRLAMEGKFSQSVPRPDEVDVILGGSPCQGFSLITADKGTDKQKKNRSMIASFASTIDFWRPKWGILENVRTIVKSSKDTTEDCFSQLICALVGMGYQTQIILGDAWSYGAPQGRVRVFLCFAAPGLRLPRPPYPSHSNPPDRLSGKLGKMTNGEAYVERLNRPTAFKYVTAFEAIADLPDISDAKMDTCINFPDHRVSLGITNGPRCITRTIPTGPYNMNFAKAYYGTEGGIPDMFPHEARLFPLGTSRTKRISKAWGRLHPHQLFGTITTFCNYQDARTGGNLMHWNQPRPLTIMEVRRAQGVPDDEVLCGSPTDQWKLVGNAVARQVSIALGLMLREAWAGTLYENNVGVAPVVISVPTSIAPSPKAAVIPVLEPQSDAYIVIDDDDDDDDDDDRTDTLSLRGLTSRPFSSTRATSLNAMQDHFPAGEPSAATAATTNFAGMSSPDNKILVSSETGLATRQLPPSSLIQDQPFSGEGATAAASTSFHTGTSNSEGKKRALSETNLATEQLSPLPLKKQRAAVVEILDSDDDVEDLGRRPTKSVWTPTEPQTINGATVVILSSDEEDTI